MVTEKGEHCSPVSHVSEMPEAAIKMFPFTRVLMQLVNLSCL